MSQFVQCQMSCCLRVMALSAMLTCGAATAVAQHTVVEKNGTSGRIETDYNAAEKVTEMRTFGDDGSLQVFDIWESQQAFDAFLEHLRPVLDDLGEGPVVGHARTAHRHLDRR